MFSKIIVLCVAISVVYSKALTDEQVEKLMGYHADCLDSTGVDEDIVNKARRGDFTDDDKFKDYLFCMGKKLGFQNDDGDLQMDVIKSKMSDFLDDSDIDMLISKCAVKKDTPQQTAFDSIKCYRENTPTHITLA